MNPFLLADSSAIPLWEILLGLESASGTGWCFLLALAGMALITKGGDLFTDAAVAIAWETRVPQVIIGATIVSMSTTFPEFMVSLTGVLAGSADIAVGNALGSCCCNIGVIVGTCALLQGWLAKRRGDEQGIVVSRVTLLGPGLFMVGAGLLFWLFAAFGHLEIGEGEQSRTSFAIMRWQAGILAAVLVGYLFYSIRMALLARFSSESMTEKHEEEEEEQGVHKNLFQQFALFLLGAVLVIWGSKLLVSNVITLAELFGVPKLVISLTVVALGTSLPEYTVSLIAVIKGHGALGLGNIIGANVLNICWVVAACGLISPLPIHEQTLFLDAPIMLTLMVCLLALSWKHERILAWGGAILLAIFILYLTLMFTVFGIST